MIDIHAHILPGLDDGPNNMAGSLDMIKKARSQGVSTIIATPHMMDGVYQCQKAQIVSACLDLSQTTTALGLDITVLPGAEVRLTHDIISQFDKKKILTLNNSDQFLLLELPSVFISDAVVQIIRQLRDRDVTAIIAHPERNAAVLKRLNTLTALLNEGALLQVTASSLVGHFGKRIRQVCELMVKKQAVSFIASDAHPGRRYSMAAARHRVESLAGESYARSVFSENPAFLVPTAAATEEAKLYYAR